MPRGLVGRSGELARLSVLAVMARAGRPVAAVLIAEPGLGKTRLLAESATRFDMPLVELRCYESAREIPLSAAAGLLRALSHVPQIGDLLDARWLDEAPTGRGLETLQLFEAAYRCLAKFGPLAVVVDDLQWADPQSLSLLQYLLSAAGPAGLRLLVLCAGRPTPIVNAFASGLGALFDPETFDVIRLAPLDRLAGAELALQLAPELEPDEAERLCSQAHGSPFWLEVLAGHGHAEASPTALIRSRLAGLDADARWLFGLLVIAAQPLGMQDVGELLDWDDERVGRAAARLMDRALVLGDAGAVRIVHDLIREAARDEFAEAERRRLHRLLAFWLEAGADEDVRQLFRALEHRQAGGLAIAELARRILGSSQRRLLGGEGLATLGAIANTSGEEAGLQLGVATLASELGEWAVAFERWGTLADRLPGAGERAGAALAAAAAAFRLGRPAEVHSLVARAREIAGAEAVVAIDADGYEAQALLWLENRVAEAGPFVDRAVGVAQQLVDRAGGIQALADAERDACVRALRAKLDLAIRRADARDVAACAELIGIGARDSAEVLAAASDRVFSMLQFEGLPRAAEPRALRILDEARRRLLPSIEVEATHWLGWIAQYLGRLDEAADYLDQALNLAARVGAPRRFTVTQLRAVAAGIDASRHDWRSAVGSIEAAITAEPDPHFRLVIRLLHVWLVGRFAAPTQGELSTMLGAMAEDAGRAGCERCLWESVLYGAEAQARSGEVAGALAALDRWDAIHPDPQGGPRARRHYVGALIEMHGAAVNLPLFDQAASEASAVGYELMRLWVELDAGIAARRVDRAQAVERLEEAARSAEAMGAFTEQRLALQELRSLGVRTWRRGADTALLTARELEIAMLVGDGKSNPEIASALFLSRKTVERHVSNILTKCGTRNRTELAKRLPDVVSRLRNEGVPR